jgi:hypothetical protein
MQRDLVTCLQCLAHPLVLIEGKLLRDTVTTGPPVPYPDSQDVPAAQVPPGSGGRGNTGHSDRYSGHTSETAQGHRPEESKGKRVGVSPCYVSFGHH